MSVISEKYEQPVFTCDNKIFIQVLYAENNTASVYLFDSLRNILFVCSFETFQKTSMALQGRRLQITVANLETVLRIYGSIVRM